jgi:hypothetical protein
MPGLNLGDAIAPLFFVTYAKIETSFFLVSASAVVVVLCSAYSQGYLQGYVLP